MVVRQLRHRHPGGFAYLVVLFSVAILATSLLGAVSVWSTSDRRERERELLWVGEQFQRALQAYARAGGSGGRYPAELGQLLADTRGATVQRHLRALYPDPITPGEQWGLVRNAEGGIIGIYSRSNLRPLIQANFPVRFESFADAQHYSDWKFLSAPDARVPREPPR